MRLQPVLWCLLDLLPVLEKPPCTPGPPPRKPCRHDDVLRLILTNMEAEHKVALRRVYAAALPAYVDRWVACTRGGGRLPGRLPEAVSCAGWAWPSADTCGAWTGCSWATWSSPTPPRRAAA